MEYKKHSNERVEELIGKYEKNSLTESDLKELLDDLIIDHYVLFKVLDD